MAEKQGQAPLFFTAWNKVTKSGCQSLFFLSLFFRIKYCVPVKVENRDRHHF